MAVKNNLAGCCTSLSDTETINYVVEAALEKLEENFTCDTLDARCLLEEVVELTLKNTISILGLLLLTELNTILRGLATLVCAMLARGEVLL